jgi:hypothetical protein
MGAHGGCAGDCAMSATATVYLDQMPPKVETRTSEYGGHIIRVDLNGVAFYLPGVGLEASGYAKDFAGQLLRAAEVVDAQPLLTGVLCDDRR